MTTFAPPQGSPAPQFPVTLAGDWTFYADLSVPPYTLLGPVTLAGFNPTWKLSDYGAADVVMPAGEGAALSRADLLRPYTWRLWASYAGIPVWAGLPIAVDDEGGRGIAMAFAELPGYLAKRQWAQRQTYTQVEQTTIARALAQPVEDIGMTITTRPGPGFARDRTYEMLESTGRAELLTNLSQVIEGPEFRAEYHLTAGRPSAELVIAYPRVGSNASGLGLTVPLGAAGFHIKWDSARQRTRTFAVGELREDAPEGAERPVEIENRPQPGVPQLDEVDDWPGVVLRTTLRERANANATSYALPVVEITGTVPVSLPRLGTYGVGDDVTVDITDPLLAGGYHTVGRLNEIQVDAAAGTAAWTVVAALPPPLPSTLARRLFQLESNQANIFRRNVEIPGGTAP
jgi:hypothetical protein